MIASVGASRGPGSYSAAVQTTVDSGENTGIDKDILMTNNAIADPDQRLAALLSFKEQGKKGHPQY